MIRTTKALPCGRMCGYRSLRKPSHTFPPQGIQLGAQGRQLQLVLRDQAGGVVDVAPPRHHLDLQSNRRHESVDARLPASFATDSNLGPALGARNKTRTDMCVQQADRLPCSMQVR